MVFQKFCFYFRVTIDIKQRIFETPKLKIKCQQFLVHF